MTDPRLDRWRTLAQRELKADPDTLTWRTPEGIAVKPVYTGADLDSVGHLGPLPGEQPFTRGPRATMYAGRPWTIRQYAGFSTAEDSNAFYRKALSPPIAATTATIPASWGTSARRASPSTASRT